MLLNLLGILLALFPATQADATCTVTIGHEYGTVVYSAPILATNAQIKWVDQGTTLNVISDAAGRWHQVALEGDQTGWVRLSTYNTFSDDCIYDSTLYEGEIPEFDTICYLETLEPTQTYFDTDITSEAEILPAELHIPVGWYLDDFLLIVYGESRSGWVQWLNSDTFQLDGNCNNLYELAPRRTTYADTQVWNKPDDAIGEVTQIIPAGTRLDTIFPYTVRGLVDAETGKMGWWSQAILDGESDPIGWVRNLDLAEESELNVPLRPRTTENARLWSEPDVTTGEIIGSLPVEKDVIVLGEPVTGPIRLDADINGEWLEVRTDEGLQGWLWIERLHLP